MDDLRGKTLLVTRAAEDAEEWARAIAARGGRALALPCLVAEEIGGAPLREELRGALAGAAFLVFTSPRGVAATRALLDATSDAQRRDATADAPQRNATSDAPQRDATNAAPRPLPAPAATTLPPIACVGPATAAAAREAFGRADFVEERGRGAALAESLAARLRRGDAVVVCAADRAQRHLEDALAPRGVEVRRLAVYRTIPAPPRDPKLDLGAWGLDAILLASPSAAEGLVNQALVPPRLAVLSIGPTTTAAARALGLAVAGEARRPGLEGLLEVLP